MGDSLLNGSAEYVVTQSQHNSYTYKRWSTVGIGLFMELCAGTLYAFGIFATATKEVMGYSETQIQLVGAIGDWGLYINAPMGWFFDKFGPKATALVGSGLIWSGYTLMGMSIGNAMDGGGATPALVFALMFFLVGQGSGAGYTASTITNVRNFPPEYRGRVTGILVSLFGLSAAFFTMIFKRYFSADSDPDDDRTEDNIKGFFFFLAWTTGGLYAFSSILIFALPEQWTQAPESMKSTVAGPFAPIGYGGAHRAKADGDDEKGMATPLTDDSLAQGGVGTREGLSGMALITSPEFITAWLTGVSGMGTGLLFINSVGNLNESLGGDLSSRTALVTTLSIANCLGRILVGTGSDMASARGVKRESWLIGCLTAMSLAMLVLGLGPTLSAIAPLAVVMGLAYGGMFAIMPVLVSNYFGLKHFGQNWGWMLLAPATGTFVWGFIAGEIYDHNITNPDTAKCFGRHCYSAAFLLQSVVCALGAVAAFYLRQRIHGRKRD